MRHSTFKMIHSDLIMQVQCIENDLRLIYGAIKPGDFDKNIAGVDRASLGTVARLLKEIDYSDEVKDLSEEDYALIEEIREIRNFWCHQCYLDYVYIENADESEKKFQEIAARLIFDEKRTYNLHKKIQKIRLSKLAEYRG